MIAHLEATILWDRVIELIEELDTLPVDQVDDRLLRLQTDGESELVLSRVRTHLRLPIVKQEKLPPDTVVGGAYRLIGELGSGGMGIVYEAVLEKTGQVVALKMIHPDLIGHELRPRFIREMKALGRLDHPGIVKIRHAGSYTCDLMGIVSEYFTMDRIEGVDLHAYLANSETSCDERLRLIRDVAIAVQYAHDRDVIHRDLKPGNIMIRTDGRAMILDFGLAAAVFLEEDGGAYVLSSEGTPPYIAPEQANAEKPSPAVDIFSLGAILYEMFAGEPLYRIDRQASFASRLETIRNPPLRRPFQIPSAPGALEAILDKALATSPEDRFPSAAAFARAINRLLPAHLVDDPPHTWIPAPGKHIPATDWVLDECLGDGAQGQVWLARNKPTISSTDEPLIPHPRVYKFCASEQAARALRREVRVFQAIKSAGSKPRLRRDFSESDVAHGNEIPGIVPIEGWSLDEPPYYIAMRYIAGASDLSQWLNGKKLTEAEAITIVCSVAKALQFSHDIGVLHRDIKPGNILVSGDPSTHEPLQVWLMDFGLAAFDETLWHTVLARSISTREDHERLVGTADYIAPEIRRQSSATTRSDLYALGVVLYRLIQGDLSVSLNDWKQHIHDPFLRDDLERCLADDPENRFPSASALSASLSKLNERRAAAEEARRLEREAEAQRRAEIAAATKAAYRRGVVRTLTIALGIVAILTGLTWFSYRKYVESWHNESRLRVAEIRALRQSSVPERRFRILQRIEEAQGDFPQADRMDLRNEALAALSVTPPYGADTVRVGQIPADAVVAISGEWIAWHNDGKLHHAKITSDDLADQWSSELPDRPSRIAINSGGEISAALSAKGELFVQEKGESLQQIGEGLGTEGLAVHASGLIAAPGSEGQVHLFVRDESGWKSTRILGHPVPRLDVYATADPPPGPVIPSAELLAFSPSGRYLAISGQASLNVQIWDAKSGELVTQCRHKHIPSALTWDQSDEDSLWSASSDGAIYRWGGFDRATPDLLRAPEVAHMAEPGALPVVSFTLSPDGAYLLSILSDGSRAFLWRDSLNEEEVQEDANIRDSGYLPSGDLWTLNGEGTLHLATNNFRFARIWKTGDNPILRFTRSADNTLIAGSCGTSVFVTDANAMQTMVRLPGESKIVGTAYSSTEPILFMCGVKGMEIWQWDRSQESATFKKIGFDSGVARGGEAVSIQADGMRWFVFSEGNHLHAHPKTPETNWEIPGEHPITSLAAGPNTPWFVASRSGAMPTSVYFPADRSVRTLPSPPEDVLTLACSADGRFVVERTTQRVILTEPLTGKREWEFVLPSPEPDPRTTPFHCAPVAITDKAELIAVATHDSQIVLISPGSTEPLATLQLPARSEATAMLFTITDSLVIGTADGHLHLWHLPDMRRELRRLGLDWEPPGRTPAAVEAVRPIY